jgi:hypothetical protein
MHRGSATAMADALRNLLVVGVFADVAHHLTRANRR